MVDEISVRAPETEEEFEDYYRLRWKVLREPWNQPKGSEKDGLETGSVHMAAFDEGAVVGCGRIHLSRPGEMQVRYMAVKEGYRGRGIGKLLLEALEAQALKLGAKSIVLDARSGAVEFYRKQGYGVVGEGHTLFETIRHWKMRKDF